MDEQKLEMLRRLAALGGMSREDVEKKIAEAEQKARHLQELAAAEDEARSHRPTADEPFELGGAISVRHIKEICSYLPDEASIQLQHPAFVMIFNQLHKMAHENLINVATQIANEPEEEF